MVIILFSRCQSMNTVCNLNLHQASIFLMHESDSYFSSLLHQTHLLLSRTCPFDRVDGDLKGTGPFTCTIQIQVPLCVLYFYDLKLYL